MNGEIVDKISCINIWRLLLGNSAYKDFITVFELGAVSTSTDYSLNLATDHPRGWSFFDSEQIEN